MTLLLISLASASGAQISPGSEYFKAGMRALAAEQYDKAETAFRAAVAADPLHDGAFYGLGQVYMATKRYPEAVKAYQDSRAAFLAAVSAEKYDAATMDRRIRDQLQVLKDYERELQRRPPMASGVTAAIERNRENIRQLEGRLNKSTGGGTPPVPAGLSMALGSAYYRTQNIEAAEKEYLEAVKVEPGFGEAHNNLAVIYMVTGRLDLADQEIAQAEKAGFKVNPKLKEDIKSRRK
ncbi:MAG TPA: tetratricopeptide repeat protein [Vicinamibacterales bacterium]|nr:tetratricopeptide repeat protein [Vicinamibacterales bacterium]